LYIQLESSKENNRGVVDASAGQNKRNDVKQCLSFVDKRKESVSQRILKSLGGSKKSFSVTAANTAVQCKGKFNQLVYDGQNWRQLFRILDWENAGDLKSWLTLNKIGKEDVMKLLEEICTSSIDNDLGADNADAYNWIKEVFKGSRGLTGECEQNLDTLSILKYESMHAKEEINGQEFQSMKVGGKIIITANKNQFGDISEGIDRTVINYNENKKSDNNKYVVNPTNFSADTHAEIILLTRFVRQVFDLGFQNKDVSIAGIRVPCSHCQQIINQFLIANRGIIKLDYLRAQQAGTMKTERQKINPDNYKNALSKLSSVITEEAIEKNVERTDQEKRWLKRMISVINYVPHTV
jgi:hypothetical protein